MLLDKRFRSFFRDQEELRRQNCDRRQWKVLRCCLGPQNHQHQHPDDDDDNDATASILLLRKKHTPHKKTKPITVRPNVTTTTTTGVVGDDDDVYYKIKLSDISHKKELVFNLRMYTTFSLSLSNDLYRSTCRSCREGNFRWSSTRRTASKTYTRKFTTKKASLAISNSSCSTESACKKDARRSNK